jgi:hypothetical protein
MRRLIAAVIALAASLPAVPAAAQPEGGVRLRLVEQSLWNGPDEGRRVLRVKVLAENLSGEDLTDLSLTMRVSAPARGRLEYEATLSADPTPELFTRQYEFGGELAAGGFRELVVGHQLTELHERGETAVYPMRLDLHSDGQDRATIRSPILYAAPEEELIPLSVATTFVVAERLHQGPDGTFRDRVLEEAVREDGTLGSLLGALAATEGLASTLAVSPLLLRQLAAMREGYEVSGDDPGSVPRDGKGARDAGEVLATLSAVARQDGVDLAAYPFAGPSLPSLTIGGLDADLARHFERGATLTEAVLGRTPDQSLVRPPLGLIDPGSLEQLEAVGDADGPVLLLDAGGAIPPEEAQGFNPAATGRLADRDGDAGLEAIVPSATVQAYLDELNEELREDPVLAAHAALGELATLYTEVPSARRGVAVTFGEAARPSGAFVRRLLDGIHSVPFLRPVSATELLNELPPAAPLQLGDRPAGRFSVEYEGEIGAAREGIARFRAVFPGEEEAAASMAAQVLLSQSQQFIRDAEGGREFLRDVITSVRSRLGEIRPPAQVFTLTSRSLRVPVTIRNRSGSNARVLVTLDSTALRFPGGRSKTFVLDGEVRTEFFEVQARRGGRFPIHVIVCPPNVDPGACRQSSPDVIAQSTIVIRSTVYNRVALLLTMGAALFLLLGWGRRVLRRART